MTVAVTIEGRDSVGLEMVWDNPAALLPGRTLNNLNPFTMTAYLKQPMKMCYYAIAESGSTTSFGLGPALFRRSTGHP